SRHTVRSGPGVQSGSCRRRAPRLGSHRGEYHGRMHASAKQGDGGVSIENQTTVEDRVVARNRTSSEVNANGRWSVTHLVARHGLLITWLAVIAVFGILRPDTFLSTSNFQSIFSSQSILLILGLGIMPALIAGAYDMSVAGTLGVSLVMVG